MGDLCIRAQGIGKQYRIGRCEPYRTLREGIMDALRAPWRRLGAATRRRQGPGDPDESTLWALRDVSFDVTHGEAVGLIGRNGAGKSTLLKVLARITEPTEGCAEIRGRVSSLLEVGTGFHPELTGRENIYLNGALLGMKKAEIHRKLDPIVAFAEIDRFLDTPVKHYSSGMYVRLAFAVAAHLDVEILVVDEVLAVGDVGFQRKCLNRMQDVGHEGRTVLFVSHNVSAITRLCARAILLHQGRIVNDGPAREVVGQYLQSGTSTTAVREWPDPAAAPGNHLARLRAVRVRNHAGQVTDTVEIQEPLSIEIEYHNLPSERFPFANVQLFNDQGVCLLASGDFTNPEWRRQARRFDGTVISTCTIPANFLAEGQVSVLAALTTHNPTEVIAYERDAVSFFVVDNSQGAGARGEYVGYFPGVVRPILDWQIRYDPASGTVQSPRPTPVERG